MENAAAQKVEDGGTDRISKLPKDILYNILYFMSKNEAARTCVLSKSWRRVSINRLKLTFDERSSSFDGPHRTGLFVSSVNRALRSYLDNHNIHRIEEFHLILMNNSESILLLEKWIPMHDATPIRELCLWILPKLGRKFPYVDDLPSAVFKSERLARLCLYRCKLSLEKIHFARLDILRLSYVKFPDERVFENIASSCPLITTMCLITTMWFKECTWFEECGDEEVKTITLEKKLHENLKHTIINDRAHRMDKRRVEIHVTTLETIHVHGCTVQIHGNKFRNLKELSLGVVILLRESFDFSSRHEFPVLTSLRLRGCLRWEYLNLRMNAPELTRIRYAAQIVPAITFTSPVSRRCTSDISIFRMQTDPASWLLDLHAFLQTISQSEIRLYMGNVLEFVERVFVENKPPVVVEVLGLRMDGDRSYYFPSFLNGMFSVCSPRIIVQGSFIEGEARSERDQKELVTFLWEFLTKRDGTFRRKKDLEGLWIDRFDTNGQHWKRALLSECVLPESKNRIRLRLKWREREANCDDSRS